MKKTNILDILLDENNKNDIIILDNENKEVTFEQIMTIPYHDEYLDTDDIYCILHPVSKSKQFPMDMVYPFKVHKEEDGEYSLQEVDDEDIIDYLNQMYLEQNA